MPTSDYLIHGTQPENLIKILKDGYIDNKPIKKDIIILKDKPSNQIFTQLIYRDIPEQHDQRPHWWSCAIVLDKKILKDYPFYATYLGLFKDNFDNGKTNNNEETIIYGEGNLSRMPNLTKLKNIINKKMEMESLMAGLDFMHSHEILFNKKIPLDKYCIKIMMLVKKTHHYKDKNRDNNNKAIIDEIIELAKKNNIPLKFRDYKLRGKNEKPINNLIDSIETD